MTLRFALPRDEAAQRLADAAAGRLPPERFDRYHFGLAFDGERLSLFERTDLCGGADAAETSLAGRLEIDGPGETRVPCSFQGGWPWNRRGLVEQLESLLRAGGGAFPQVSAREGPMLEDALRRLREENGDELEAIPLVDAELLKELTRSQSAALDRRDTEAEMPRSRRPLETEGKSVTLRSALSKSEVRRLAVDAAAGRIFGKAFAGDDFRLKAEGEALTLIAVRNGRSFEAHGPFIALAAALWALRTFWPYLALEGWVSSDGEGSFVTCRFRGRSWWTESRLGEELRLLTALQILLGPPPGVPEPVDRPSRPLVPPTQAVP
ncbi:MAG: hypothetical protein ACYDCL_21030 [Myxococcales bacterium]